MAEINKIFKTYVNSDKDAAEALHGAAFIVKDKNGETLYSNAFGKLNFESNSPSFTADSVCWVASLTKLMTAVSAMQLVEKGMIGLDDDMGKICPQLSNKDVLKGFEENGKPILEKQSKPISLRQLLTHSSGLAYDVFDPDMAKWSAAVGRTVSSSTFTLEGFTFPLSFQPGEGWVYGVGLDWVGQVIETLTGLTLGDYMQKHIFAPLGMSSTTFRVNERSDLASQHAAVGFRALPRGPLTAGADPLPPNPPVNGGGAGLYSTANDYARLLGALVKGDSAVLKVESVREMCKPQLLNNKHLQSAFDGDLHNLFCPEFPKALQVNCGLGGAINMEDLPGKRRQGSMMWTGMANSRWWFDPHTGIAAVLVTQVLPPGDAVSIDLYDELEKAVYKELI